MNYIQTVYKILASVCGFKFVFQKICCDALIRPRSVQVWLAFFVQNTA
jgi:hypothetical protein